MAYTPDNPEGAPTPGDDFSTSARRNSFVNGTRDTLEFSGHGSGSNPNLYRENHVNAHGSGFGSSGGGEHQPGGLANVDSVVNEASHNFGPNSPRMGLNMKQSALAGPQAAHSGLQALQNAKKLGARIASSPSGPYTGPDAVPDDTGPVPNWGNATPTPGGPPPGAKIVTGEVLND